MSVTLLNRLRSRVTGKCPHYWDERHIKIDRVIYTGSIWDNGRYSHKEMHCELCGDKYPGSLKVNK